MPNSNPSRNAKYLHNAPFYQAFSRKTLPLDSTKTQNLNAERSSGRFPSLSISSAVARTADLSISCSVTAKRKIASNQSLTILVRHSSPTTASLIWPGSLSRRHVRCAARSARNSATPNMPRLARIADQIVRIMVTYVWHDGGDLGLGLGGQFNQRQANLGRHEAKQAQRVFERGRTGLAEQHGGQFRDRNCPTLRTGDLSLPAGQKHIPAQTRRNIGRDGNTAVAALRNKGPVSYTHLRAHETRH